MNHLSERSFLHRLINDQFDSNFMSCNHITRQQVQKARCNEIMFSKGIGGLKLLKSTLTLSVQTGN